MVLKEMLFFHFGNSSTQSAIIDEKVERLEIHHALSTLSEGLSAGLEDGKHGKHSPYGANAMDSCSKLKEYP